MMTDNKEVIDLLSSDDEESNNKAPSSSQDAWTCTKCTLLNPPSTSHCDACGSTSQKDDDEEGNINEVVLDENSAKRHPSLSMQEVADQISDSAIPIDSKHTASPGTSPTRNLKFPAAVAGDKRRLSNKNEGLENSTRTMKKGKTSSKNRENIEYPCYWDGNQFVDTHPDTEATRGFIWVRNSNFTHSSPEGALADRERDMSGLEREWNTVHAPDYSWENPPKHEKILELARKYKVLYGKWCIAVSVKWAHATWTKIRNGVLQGKLGCTAKIMLKPDDPRRQVLSIAVYVSNFFDKAHVLRMRKAIRDVGVCVDAKDVLRFKPDCFTCLKLYGGARRTYKKFVTSIYSCGGKKDPECTTLKLTYVKCTKSEGCPCCYPKCFEQDHA